MLELTKWLLKADSWNQDVLSIWFMEFLQTRDLILQDYTDFLDLLLESS